MGGSIGGTIPHPNVPGGTPFGRRKVEVGVPRLPRQWLQRQWPLGQACFCHVPEIDAAVHLTRSSAISVPLLSRVRWG